MKISVIIPTYKPLEYLWACLFSLREQTLNHLFFEIVLVLNGCKEPYYTRIQKYIIDVLAGCNVVLIQTDISGVSNARNMGLDKAKGEYITFMDDDDVVSPTYLESLLDIAKPDIVALSNTLTFNSDLSDAYPSSISRQYQALYKNRCIVFSKARKYFSPPWAKLIHKDIIGNRRFNTRFTHGEDSLYMFLISDRMKYVQFTSPDAIYYRRIRENSATTSKRSLWAVVKNKHENAIETTRIYFSNIKGYSFNFYVTRILAGVKAVLVDMLNRIKK